MRIALCFHGIAEGENIHPAEGGSVLVSFEQCAPYFYKNIINANDNVDVFVHTWSGHSEEQIEHIYNPVLSEYQKPIYPNFKHPYEHFNFDPNIQKKMQSVYSRWYSFKKVIELKKQHERENNFFYDCVVVCRFDLVFYRPIIFSHLDMDKFYVSNWHYNWTQNKKFFGYPDCWFFSNTDTIDKFAALYEKLDEYMIDGGEYEDFIINQVGEPYPAKVSSHALARWHLYKCGLIKKERFLGLEYETWSLLRKSHLKGSNPYRGFFDQFYEDYDIPMDCRDHSRSQIE